MLFAGCATATDVTNITNIITGLQPEIVGGSDVVSLHPHYVDNWFSVYNDGHVTYQVYAYNYVGVHDPPYMSGFICAIEPGQMGILNNNASYRIYATSPPLTDLSPETVEKKISPETVEKKINQYWYIGAIGIIVLLFIIKLYKVIK
jgi:hypothetical protein